MLEQQGRFNINSLSSRVSWSADKKNAQAREKLN